MSLMIAAFFLSLTAFLSTYFMLHHISGQKTKKQRLEFLKISTVSVSQTEDQASLAQEPKENRSSAWINLFFAAGAASLWGVFQPDNFTIKLLVTFSASLIGRKLWGIYLNRKRRLQIEEELPVTLDLLQLCIEAGMSMNAALVRVADENIKSPISELFRQTFQEMNLGVPMHEAFQHMGIRSRVPDLKFFSTAVIQAEKLGLSMGDNLRNHARLVREQLRTKTREKIQKLPIQMIIPLVLFIMPAIFTVVAGPAFIQIKQGFFKN